MPNPVSGTKQASAEAVILAKARIQVNHGFMLAPWITAFLANPAFAGMTRGGNRNDR
jgi:hypothetical protein